VPAKQRGRGDEERRPPRPRQQPRQPRQHRPIGRLQIQPPDLAAQDRDLMPQHEYLDRIGAFAARHQDDQLEYLTQDQVAEQQDHGR
jgi:hypothetical protein